MRKTTKKSITRIISIFLVSIILLSSVVPIFATDTPISPADGITSGQTYMLKNKVSGKYLTLPGYFEYASNKNNVYQDIATINDQYSRAVRVTYTTSGYTIVPLLYENLGNGYVSVEENGNVIISQEASYWKLEYSEEINAYLLSCDGKYLNAMGLSNGGVDETGVNSSGNIVVKDNSANYWIFEPVTVNPHIFKSASVTKKNIGMNNEWLFKLSDSEMVDSNCLVTGCTVSGNVNLVQAERYGKYVVIKMKDDGDEDRSNDFAIITITVERNQVSHKRTVVVQNSGTGAGDACTTKTFKGTTPIHEIILEPNQSKDILLAFHSSAGSFVAETWKSTDSCVTLAECEEKLITGTNFAVAKVNEVGLSCIEVTDAQGNCLRMIINVISSDTTQTQSSIINVTLDTTSLVLDANRGYLLRVPSSLEPTSWHFSPSSNVGYMYMWDNYIYMNTYSDDVDSAFIDSGYNSMTLTVVGAGRLEIELNVRQESKGRFEFGMGGDIYVGVGQTVKLVPEYTAYAYTSEDSFVAEVDSCGNVTALSTGSTIITAKSRYDLEAPDYSIYINVVLGEGVYYVNNVGRTQHMQPEDGSADANKIVALQGFDETNEFQKWSLVYKGEGYYNIINEYSGLALSVRDGHETTVDRSLIQAVPDYSDRQLWYIQELGDNKYIVSSKASEQSDNYLVMASGEGLFNYHGYDVEQRVYQNNGYYHWEFFNVTEKVAFVSITQRGFSSHVQDSMESLEASGYFDSGDIGVYEKDWYTVQEMLSYFDNSEVLILSMHGTYTTIDMQNEGDDTHPSLGMGHFDNDMDLSNLELLVLLTCSNAKDISNDIVYSSSLDEVPDNIFELVLSLGAKRVIAFNVDIGITDGAIFIESFFEYMSEDYELKEAMERAFQETTTISWENTVLGLAEADMEYDKLEQICTEG